MDLVVKGRNGRVPNGVRRLAEHKLARIGRTDPRVVRVEIELLEERNPRVDGHQKVKAVALTRRGVFRARGKGDDPAAALDQVVDRLDRQLKRARSRFRARLLAGANRLKSGRTARGAEGAEPAD